MGRLVSIRSFQQVGDEMDQIIQGVLIGLATNYFSGFTQQYVIDFFKKAIVIKPNLKLDLLNAKNNQDIDRIFKDAVGVIDAQADTGSVEVDQNFLTAIKGIRFDHQHGKVTISGSTINAPELRTGGSGTGLTFITNTTMESAGTKIQVGVGASIKMTGNAKITQT